MDGKRWYSGDFVKLYSLHASFLAADAFAWSLGFLYFIKQGIPITWLFIFAMVQFGTVYLLLLNTHRFSTRGMFIYSFSIRVLALALLGSFFTPALVYIIALLQGTTIFAYWIAFNVLYFRLPNTNDRAFLSSLYFAIIPFLGMLLPPIAGIVASSYGFSTVFMLGAILMIIPLGLSIFAPNITIKYDASKAAVHDGRVRMIIFFEGFFSAVHSVYIPFFILLFIKEEIALGIFLSYLSLAGIIGSLVIAKIADRLRSRKMFIYPATIALSLSIIALGLSSQNAYLFYLFAGIFSTINVIAAPFCITLVFDNYKNVTAAVIARETMLALGRITATMIALATFVVFKIPAVAFIIAGMATLLYPYLVWKHRLY
ncbi:MFS transporter [Candidatus Woesearchaeota archaeon]|nr:MFS transporter [Candidatus Woesearchaeota archaeon]